MNCKTAYCFAIIFLSILGVNDTNAQSSKSDQQSKSKGKEEVVFYDDFSGSTLDRSKWNVVDEPSWVVNDELQAYVDSSNTVFIAKGAEAEGAQNGALVIQGRYSPKYTTKHGRTFDFLSGRLDTKGKFEFTYGNASARIKLPAGSGFWPAFWILGTGNWPETGEIDIMENIGEPDWIGVALHGKGYSGETPIADRYYFKPGTDVTQWHIYSVDWNPDSLVFKVDGEVVYKVSRHMINFFGKWAFDNPKYLIVNLAIGGIYPLKNNGVRTPYLGLTESTLQTIKDNKAKVYVDWVKVVKTSANR